MSERLATHPGLLDSERIVRIEERLETGNRTHADFRERLDRLERRGEERAKTLLGWVFGFAGVLAAWAYSVTTKPDAEEVRRMIRVESQYTQDADKILRVVDRYDEDGDLMRSALEEIRLEQRTVSSKLDTVIEAISKPKRGKVK